MPLKFKSVLFFSVICCATLLLSCNSRFAPYGKNKIASNPADTIATKLRIAAIKAINNNIFEPYTYKGKQNPELKYRLLKSNVEHKKLPLVIVFHGSGAVGDDNTAQLGLLAKLWASPEISAKYPAYILAPQFPSRSSNYVTDQQRNVLASVGQPGLQAAIELIDSLKKVLDIDESRIYVIGFSMGASSVINVLSARPDLFAAAVSIAGIPQFDQVKILAEIPIWLIHGNSDTENPFNSDLQFFKEVSYKNKTRFWEFDQKAHNDIFSTVILGENIPKWLFQFQKLKN